MEECLTKRSVETKTDYVMKPLTAGEAVYARDALSKAVYDRLFNWLVRRINDRIKVFVTLEGENVCGADSTHCHYALMTFSHKTYS